MQPIWKDFKWHKHGLTVRETGAYIPFNFSLIKDVIIGMNFICGLQLTTLFLPKSWRIYFLPHPPRAWYLLWAVLKRAGIRIVLSHHKADIAFYFDDNTQSAPPALLHTPLCAFNFECRDISKTHVGEVFEKVFGYNLNVDPEHYTGLMTVKSEKNGAHDGYIVEGPCPRQKDKAYQKLIDNSHDHDHVYDIRCPTIFGDIPIIYIKIRPKKQRFANMNTQTLLKNTENYLTREERDNIALFCRKMNLDWGGLDILRDKADNRIYIVDVNKTDMGPPLSLPIIHKFRSVKKLAEAFLKTIENRKALQRAIQKQKEQV